MIGVAEQTRQDEQRFVCVCTFTACTCSSSAVWAAAAVRSPEVHGSPGLHGHCGMHQAGKLGKGCCSGCSSCSICSRVVQAAAATQATVQSAQEGAPAGNFLASWAGPALLPTASTGTQLRSAAAVGQSTPRCLSRSGTLQHRRIWSAQESGRAGHAGPAHGGA